MSSAPAIPAPFTHGGIARTGGATGGRGVNGVAGRIGTSRGGAHGGRGGAITALVSTRRSHSLRLADGAAPPPPSAMAMCPSNSM
ncbi:MAG TPA: hypothetical protein VFB74_14740 [Kribbellaceae bacterium]|nr:hypothetical protein [Kribbellaceae bacterium]